MKMSNKVKIGLIASVPFLLGAAVSTDEASSPYTRLSLTGVGYESQATEFLQIRASTGSFSTTPSRAMADNAQTMDRIRRKLEQLGIDQRDFRTSNFQFQKGRDPDDDPNNGREARKGYNVQHSLSIVVRDPDKAGQMMDTLIEVGADNLAVQHGYGESSDISPEKLKRARANAIKDAQAKANDYAKALGMRVRRIVQIQDGSGYLTDRPLPSAAGPAVDVRTQIDTPASTVQAAVNVSFELEK